MSVDYKLCPKCNNALDKKETKCPYCGEVTGVNFSIWNNPSIINNSTSNNSSNKRTSGCVIFFIFFIAIQIIGAVLSFISWILSSLF